MMTVGTNLQRGLLVVLFLSASACSEKVAPPTIVTELVVIGQMSPSGADIEATLDVTNPNSVELSATGVQSKITIGDKPDMAKASMLQPLILPARTHTKPKVGVKIEWTDPAALSALAAKKQPAPYVVEGSADFTTSRGISAKTPFTIRGMMSADELAKAAGTPASPSK